MANRARAIVLATAADQPEITASDRLYVAALQRYGFAVVGAPWDGPRAAFDGAAAVVIRSTWGYYRASDAFRDWTEVMATASRLFNPIGLVRWNLRKDYIAKLAAASVRVPQTHFVACEVDAIDKVFGDTGWSRAVVKPLTGASGYSVELVTREGVARSVSRLAAEARAGGVLVQEFLPEIADGELSLIYFDGIFSHAVRKRPPHGEFRVNSRFGATRSAELPSRAVTEQGAAVLRTLPEVPLYARVDGIVRDGALIVIEIEVLEPALFMEFDPSSAERFAEATLRRIAD
jgi:glutathione synthase/RimK-type ligase-like ATP-grasp enzyme